MKLLLIVLLTTPPCTKAFSVDKPCEAVCLPPEDAAAGLSCLEVTVPKLQLKMGYEVEKRDLRIESLDKQLITEARRGDEHYTLLGQLLEEPAWYKSKTAHFVYGMGAAAAAILVGAWALGQVAD